MIAHFMQSSHELVNVQHLTRQSLPVASEHFPTAIGCQVLLPIIEAELLSLPLHNASFEFMANMSITVVKISFNSCRDYFLLQEQWKSHGRIQSVVLEWMPFDILKLHNSKAKTVLPVTERLS